jgi:mannose-6-phosphate isomerase-like protein (cupin superfamily)
MRRVVTGHSAEGQSIFVSDGEPPRVIKLHNRPGLEQVEVWATPNIPDNPADEKDPTPTLLSLVPSPGETRFRIVRFPSALEAVRAVEAGIDPVALAKEYLQKAPGLAEAHEPGGFGWHRTNTVDYGIVLSGRIRLELDNGVKRTLEQGDCVIQNGTRHAWRNEFEDPCFMAFIMIGAGSDKS